MTDKYTLEDLYFNRVVAYDYSSLEYVEAVDEYVVPFLDDLIASGDMDYQVSLDTYEQGYHVDVDISEEDFYTLTTLLKECNLEGFDDPEQVQGYLIHYCFELSQYSNE